MNISWSLGKINIVFLKTWANKIDTYMMLHAQLLAYQFSSLKMEDLPHPNPLSFPKF